MTGGNFDGYWLFKYLMENILTDGYCLSTYTCKRCTVFKQSDGLNFDNLAGKHQKRQNFPRQNFVLYGISFQFLHRHIFKLHVVGNGLRATGLAKLSTQILIGLSQLCSKI